MPALILDNGCRVVLEARSASTGNAVSGVFVNTVAIYGVNVGADTGQEPTGPFLYVPGPEDGGVSTV